MSITVREMCGRVHFGERLGPQNFISRPESADNRPHLFACRIAYRICPTQWVLTPPVKSIG